MSYKSGVYEHKTQKKVQGHAVVLLGWGTDPATQQEYWLLQKCVLRKFIDCMWLIVCFVL